MTSPDKTVGAPQGDAADQWGSRLPRQLGLISAIAVLLGTTIGSGIFRVPARVAEAVPSPLPMLGVWVVGGLMALCGALTYAELAGMFPRSGGLYQFVKEGHGGGVAFLYGWSELLVIRASSLGAISTVLGGFIAGFLKLSWWQIPLAIIGIMLVISLPPVIIAWLKLRQRNLGPILDANGWAVNAKPKINIPFGRSLTGVAKLPPGSHRDLIDPFAEKRKPRGL